MELPTLDQLQALIPLLPKKKPVHKLKWKLPEQRFCAPIEDAEKRVFELEKLKAKFVSGGEFMDVVHAKPYGEGVFAYFIVRTEKKTEDEHILFDGYMIQEEEPLGLNLSSSFSFMEDLEGLGYKQSLQRAVTEWRFLMLPVKVAVFDVEQFGAFMEFALPATNFENDRKRQEKKLDDLFKKFGLKKEDALPTDVITLQWLSQQQEAAQGQGPDLDQGGPG
ncbi:hypothetical protein HY994_02280 [Candidatus Micrarchaeota archaeon]|nr:hypothetical protein [Candidatus Micrarchaeota archaeon]